jgi:hypothetical protein
VESGGGAVQRPSPGGEGQRRGERTGSLPRTNITTLPTLLIIKGGKVSEQRVGLISRDNLVKLIEPHLG